MRIYSVSDTRAFVLDGIQAVRVVRDPTPAVQIAYSGNGVYTTLESFPPENLSTFLRQVLVNAGLKPDESDLLGQAQDNGLWDEVLGLYAAEKDERFQDAKEWYEQLLEALRS